MESDYFLCEIVVAGGLCGAAATLAAAFCGFLRRLAADQIERFRGRRRPKPVKWQLHIYDSEYCHVRTVKLSAETVGRLMRAIERGRLS
jgi:hypothetical protein